MNVYRKQIEQNSEIVKNYQKKKINRILESAPMIYCRSFNIKSNFFKND